MELFGDVWLFANNPVATDLLDVAICIRNHPMAGHQAAGNLTVILNGDGVCEYEPALLRVALT